MNQLPLSMAFKVPIFMTGSMSAYFLGTGGGNIFVSIFEWKKVKRFAKPSKLEPVYQPLNGRYKMVVSSYLISNKGEGVKYRKVINLINKNFQRHQSEANKLQKGAKLLPTELNAYTKNLITVTKDFIKNHPEDAKPIHTRIGNFYKESLINSINSGKNWELSYTSWIHKYAKAVFAVNGDVWSVMNKNEMNEPTLLSLRKVDYISINYIPLKKIKYTSSRPLITNNILSRMGDEMLNRSCDKQ